MTTMSYDSFSGFFGDVQGIVRVADMRQATRPSSTGLLWLHYILRRTDGSMDDHSHGFCSLPKGGYENILLDDKPPGNYAIWEIWIGEADHQFWEVVSVGRSGMTMGFSSGVWDYPDELRRPWYNMLKKDLYVGAHLRVAAADFEIISHTQPEWTGSGYLPWNLTVGSGVDLREHYSVGDEARIVPRFSGRDVAVVPYFAHPLFQKG